MTTNFTSPVNCKPVLGAKRFAPVQPPSLKPEDEECYAEKTYEEKNDFELQESEAKIKLLNQLAEEIMQEPDKVQEKLKECFNKPSHMFSRAIISSEGIKTFSEFERIEDFHTVQDPKGGNIILPPTEETVNGIPLSLYELGVRSKRHPRTVRKYMAVLLTFFSNLETEYVNKDGIIFVKKLPVFYATKEKLISIKEHEFKEITNGNTNFMPRASFVLDSMEYDSNRQINKTLAVSNEISMDSLSGKNPYSEVTYAPSPYNINCRMTILTRGIDDALMIAEQLGSFFNPFYTMKVIDNDFGEESEVKLKIEGITFEPIEAEEFSQNEVQTDISFTLYGNLFKGTTKEYLADEIIVSYNI